MSLTLTLSLTLEKLENTNLSYKKWKKVKVKSESENSTNLSYKKCPHREDPTPCLPSWLGRKTVSNMIKQHKLFGSPKMLSMFRVLPMIQNHILESNTFNDISGVMTLFAYKCCMHNYAFNALCQEVSNAICDMI